jgi:arginyl-tRNA synthetase
MADPALVLSERIRAAVRAAFGDEHGSVDPLVRRSDRADYQANLAMGLGKTLGRPPRAVAEQILNALDVSGVCERAELAGPGFINLTLGRDFLETELGRIAFDERLGVPLAAAPETVVIDYSAPNVAKEMHVGHLRSNVIGDALARVLEHQGQRVVRQNHIGDWGTPFGKLIEHLVDRSGEDEPHSIGELNDFYREANAKFESDPAFAERARRRVVLLQSGDRRTLELWQKLVDASKRYFSAVYERLGMTLSEDDIRGESFYNPLLPELAEELERRGIATTSDGALCVFVPGFTNREGDPLPLIVRKNDGGFGYAATDLAAIRYRTTVLGATRVLYVVGAPQQQHFAMVFEVARMAGWLVPPARAEHVAFGSVLGPDKKMFKSRAGESVRLIELLDEAVDRAGRAVAERRPDVGPDEMRRLSRQIGIGALKYVDLSSDRSKDYVFDWDRLLAFEGNTGPYLQYAHARIRSILRKAGEQGAAPARAQVSLAAPAERALALELLAFGSVVEQVAESLQPHKLCSYLYQLATSFTVFYEACPVLKAETAELCASRLALSELTGRVLASGLDLLGIEAPERM